MEFSYAAPKKSRKKRVAAITAGFMLVGGLALAAFLFLARGSFDVPVSPAPNEGVITLEAANIGPVAQGSTITLNVTNPNSFDVVSIGWATPQDSEIPDGFPQGCRVTVPPLNTTPLAIPANGDASITVPARFVTSTPDTSCPGLTEVHFSNFTAQLTSV